MQHRRFLTIVALATVASVPLAACGDDETASGTPSTTPADSLPPVDETGEVPGGGYTYPTGANDVVFEYAERGGFVPTSYAFQNLPVVLVSGDGRVVIQGPMIEIYPGPFLPNLLQRTITPEGIQRLLGAADDAGLFREVDYDADMNIADASTANVTIAVDGQTWVHAAYALGPEFSSGSPGSGSEDRDALAAFIEQVRDLETLVGAENLGPEQPFTAENYRIQAIPVENPQTDSGDGIEPTIIDWPAEIGVRLADASACAVVPVAEVGELFETANQLTFFADAGATYQVAATLQLPGTSC